MSEPFVGETALNTCLEFTTDLPPVLDLSDLSFLELPPGVEEGGIMYRLLSFLAQVNMWCK